MVLLSPGYANQGSAGTPSRHSLREFHHAIPRELSQHPRTIARIFPESNVSRQILRDHNQALR